MCRNLTNYPNMMLEMIQRKIILVMKRRNINFVSIQDKIYKYLIVYIKKIIHNNQKIIVLILFQKVFELSLLFKGGKYVPKFMEMIKNMFFHLFKPRYSFSYKQIPGASQNLTDG